MALTVDHKVVRTSSWGGAVRFRPASRCLWRMSCGGWCQSQEEHCSDAGAGSPRLAHDGLPPERLHRLTGGGAKGREDPDALARDGLNLLETIGVQIAS